MQPKNENNDDQQQEQKFDPDRAAKLVSTDQIVEFFRCLFGSVSWSSSAHICLRGIGEKGTHQEGVARSDNFFEPSLADPTDRIINCAEIWARNQIACFVVPAVLKAQKGTAENVSLMTNLVVDLDSGDTNAKLEFLRHHIGEPSMIIRSGGVTEDGHPKRHIYFVLNEPTDDIKKSIFLRDMIARKCGGDISMGLGVDGNPYGRAHQPVRVAGSVHSKNGVSSACKIEKSSSGATYSFETLEQQIHQCPVGPWGVNVPQTGKQLPGIDTSSLFSPESGYGHVGAKESLKTEVHENGTDRTRWGEFNKVAGLHISMARRGELTMRQALDNTIGWALSMMKPPWPENRLINEFESLLSHDIRQHGPMPEPEKPIIEEEQRISEGGLGLKMWAAHRWVTEPKPDHKFIVKDLVIKGEPHLFVAQGGSGKTFQVADLAMKIAAFDKDKDEHWFGQKILMGGTAVLVLCEDSQTEMHRRLLEINENDRIKKSADRLIVLPMTRLGGAFPLVEIDFRTGESRPSKRWMEMLALLREIPDLCLVCIDTLNSVSHGDENSALAIGQMMREAHRVCGELDAALVVNHHVRKASKDQKIASLEDLNSAIRGSSAISSYFRINFGMFACVDYVRRMKAMGLKPERNCLWKFGVAKANIHGLLKGERTLLRGQKGLMEDVTSRDVFAEENYQERCAWLVAACRIAAQKGHPYTTGGKNAASGLYRRRAELPVAIRHLGEYELPRLLSLSMENGELIGCSVRGSKSKQYLDVPTGPLATENAGAEINSGAYTDAPDWSRYTYCEALNAVTEKGAAVEPFGKKHRT